MIAVAGVLKKKNSMDINEIKEKMKSYTDLFGGDLNHYKIDSATSLKDLYDILDYHYYMLSDMANDAQNNLERFRRKIGLFIEPERENTDE